MRPFWLLASTALLLGCGRPTAINYPSAIVRAARYQRPPATAQAPTQIAAGYVESTLREAGLRFGTDGTPRALLAYLRYSHRLVAASASQPGDVVFFDTTADGQGGCADHVGIVEKVDRDGRITFLEARDGRVRRSYALPGRPYARRDESGRIANSFLRPKAIDDVAGARYTAGEMLCAVGRVK